MIDWIIEKALAARGLVLLGAIAVIAAGIYQYRQMPVDAFPDISPIMVPIFAEAHGMAPEEIERLITYPIESAMNGLPGVTQIKSTSAFGMAVIYVYFQDDIDIYFARQLVNERLGSAQADLPEMHEPPGLGPISTGLGQIFIYYLTLDEGIDTEGKESNTYLREINDWIVKFQLQTVPGVTDILSIGGHVLQYEIRIDPSALNEYNLSIENIVEAVQANNRNAGGQFLVLGSEEYLVRGLGLLRDLENIRSIPVKVVDGVSIHIHDLAEVAYGNEIRRGVVTHNGTVEVVSGIVLKLYGENTSDVISRLYGKVADVQESLPAGVHLVPYYEQAELVDRATQTVKDALLAGAVLVLLTLFFFLGNLRSAFIVALSLPLCALIAVLAMRWQGISANLMSLGGIAIGIGMLGDGAIVMVENIYRHITESEHSSSERAKIIAKAAKEVGRPIVFSIAIIVMVFLPIFALQGVEGKMFSPLAFTVSSALAGSLLTALFVAPAMASFLLRGGNQQNNFLITALQRIYRPLLSLALRWKFLVAIIAGIAACISLVVLPRLGTEFMPTLEEGSILIGVTMAPSIALEEATDTVMQIERKIMQYDEVHETVSRIGRPEAGSHPHPVNYAEIHIELNEESEWKNFKTKKEIVESLSIELAPIPGVQLNFTQPIQNAFDELLSGIKAQVAVKVFGEDLGILQKLAGEIREAIEDVPGLKDLATEQSFGQPQVQIATNRKACSRYGVTVDEILEIVEMAVGGEVIGDLYRNTRRYGIHVRFQEIYRNNPEAIGNILLRTGNGALIPLQEVADVKQVIGPIQINRENNQRRWIVQGNVRGRDLGSVVSEIQERIRNRVDIPSGYFVDYGGQFENQQRAMKRLTIIVPAVLAAIFILLWMSFGSPRHASLILLNVPLALIGGVFGLFITGEYLSVPASVGFIALFGIAVQNGVVLVSCFNQIRHETADINDAVLQAAMMRLRPVLLTAVTTVLGLLPLLLSHGIGSEVQRPLAVVVVFGLTSSTLLTLFVLPTVYAWVERNLRST